MLEKKTMIYVTFEYPSYEPETVTVIFNTETLKVELYCFSEEDGWFTPNEFEHFYSTEKEAKAELEEWKKELLSKRGESKQYVDIMNNWLHEARGDNEDFEEFSEEDYLPKRNHCSAERYYESLWEKSKTINKYLLDFIHSGFININGDSFKKEDVAFINWGTENAKITLINNYTIITATEEEFTVIKDIFGKNHSGYVYGNLAKETRQK